MSFLIDRPPSRWVPRLFRMPAVMFRLRLGWLFMNRVLMLSHVGRRTGKVRATVLEVLSHQNDPPTWFVASAWADRSDWYRNLQKDPNAEIAVGRNRFRVIAHVVDTDISAHLYSEYVQDHRWSARFVGRAIGIDLLRSDPQLLANRIPLVALTTTEK